MKRRFWARSGERFRGNRGRSRSGGGDRGMDFEFIYRRPLWNKRLECARMMKGGTLERVKGTMERKGGNKTGRHFAKGNVILVLLLPILQQLQV